MHGFVLGNGESRIGIDLEKLRKYGPIYGCNALYRDFTPDVLISIDKGMIKEIQKAIDSGEYTGHLIWRDRRARVMRSTKESVTYEDRGWSAGPTAAWLLCERIKNVQIVYLVGFDLYGRQVEGKRPRFNNVYKDTPNYRASGSPETFFGNWVEQFRRLFHEFPKVRFLRVGNVRDKFPPEWQECPNIKFVSNKPEDCSK